MSRQKAIERISQFNEPLLNAFDRMVRGVNVRITQEFREYWGVENLGKWFFIQKINDDETVQICGQYHDIFTNVELKHIVF